MRGNKVIAPYITARGCVMECVLRVVVHVCVCVGMEVVGMVLTGFGLRRLAWLFLWRAVHQDTNTPPPFSLLYP